MDFVDSITWTNLAYLGIGSALTIVLCLSVILYFAWCYIVLFCVSKCKKKPETTTFDTNKMIQMSDLRRDQHFDD
jgi:hypothetical protein